MGAKRLKRAPRCQRPQQRHFRRAHQPSESRHKSPCSPLQEPPTQGQQPEPAMFHSSSPATSYGDLLPPGAAPTAYGFFDVNSCSSFPSVLASSPPYSSSLPSTYLHRSSSTHSLPLHQYIPDMLSSLTFSSSPPQHHQLQPLAAALSSSPPSSSCEFLDFNAPGPVRRVFSTGDLQVTQSSRLSSFPFRSVSFLFVS